MVENEQIKNLMSAWIQENKISGAVVLVRKNGKIVCDSQYGYADVEKKVEMKKNSIFRLASMTKPIISICMMRLEEEGKLCIKDPIADYLPIFKKLHSAEEKKSQGKQTERLVTIEDILRHCSGMGCEQETVHKYESKLRKGQSLEERMALIADIALDYQPGEVTRYSAVMAYEILGYLIEVVSGMDLNQFILQEICKPLEIQDLSFLLSDSQKDRMVHLYEYVNNGLKDVSETDEFWKQINPLDCGYYSGSAGLFGSMEVYDRIVQILTKNGRFNGKQFLKEETIQRMSHGATGSVLGKNTGQVWGLGMLVVEDPVKAGRMVGKGTYGWSGAFGTHFYIDPERDVTVVLGVNCSNIGGSSSKLSQELENVVYKHVL